MKWILSLLLALVALDVYADGKVPHGKVEEDREILAVIRENLEAAEREDFDAWMATYHEKARMCKIRGAEMRECFRVYDMKYKLDKVKVLDRSGEEAKVLFVQINQKVRGPDMPDKKVTGIHILKKSYGKWKIYDTEIKRIQELR